MPTYSKKILSATIAGEGELISSTSSATPTLIHTGASVSSTIQEVWLYAVNHDPQSGHYLYLNWGPSASSVPYILGVNQGAVIATPGWLLSGSTTPHTITAFADAANKVSIYGYVNEIS